MRKFVKFLETIGNILTVSEINQLSSYDCVSFMQYMGFMRKNYTNIIDSEDSFPRLPMIHIPKSNNKIKNTERISAIIKKFCK